MDFFRNSTKKSDESSKHSEESKIKNQIEILNERQKSIYVDTEPIKCINCGTVAFVMVENGEY